MRRDLLIAVWLAGLTFGVFWPVANHEFICYDDPQFITENPQIQSGLTWKTLVYAFTRPIAGNWHPVTSLSHALDCECFGVNAGAHHLMNAALHAANAALLFLALQQLMRARSAPTQADKGRFKGTSEAPIDSAGPNAVVAGIFAWHPLRVESVAWIAERKDLLAGFFFLLTLWFYARWRSNVRESGMAIRVKEQSAKARERKPAWIFYMGSLLSFALGLMSKPMVVTLPFVLLLLDFWPLQRVTISNSRSQVPGLRGLIYEKIPFLFLSSVACWITLRVQQGAGAMQTLAGINMSERLVNALTSCVRYLGKMFWPTNLAVIYPHPAKHYFLTDAWPDWEIVLAGLLLLTISIFCIVQLRPRPYLAFGWCWFLGTLVPVIGLVQVGEQAMADRYTYIPLIGPAIALVWGLSELARTKGAQPGRWTMNFKFGAIVALFALLAGLTRHQLAYWQNSVSLFEHTIAVTADNPSAQFALGVGLEGKGQASKAMVHYRVAVAIDPHYAKAYYNMGQVLRKAGYWKPAAEAYLSAARWNPTDVPTKLNLASVLPHLGRSREAVDWFNRALELEPDSLEGLNNLAWLLCTSPQAGLRNGARAVQLAERACSLTGFRTPVLLGTLAAAYAEAGQFPQAVATAQSASALASEAGDSATASKNQEFMVLYQGNKPYHEAQ